MNHLPDNYLTLNSEQTRILCDPILTDDTDLGEHDYIILTHIDFDTLDLLDNYVGFKPIYLSFELFKLIQKLVRVDLLEPVQANLKILPYNYSVKLGGIQMAAFKNDDGQFGSFTLIARGSHSTIGYCDSFYSHGNHKKRIKKWQKAFREKQLDTLILGSKIAPISEQKNILSENGMQEMLLKFITKNPADQPLTALLSPFDPERLYRYDKTAKQNQRPIVWDKNYLQLLESFYPFAEFFSAKNLPTTAQSIIVQVEQSQQLKHMNTFLDPALLHPNAVNIAGLIYQKHLCALTLAELNEFVSYIDPGQVIMKEDRSLAQDHSIPQKWLRSLELTI